jgi:hypothetical protein
MEPARKVQDDHGEEPTSKANLRAIEGGGEATGPKSDHLESVPKAENTVYDRNDSKPVIRPDLRQQEGVNSFGGDRSDSYDKPGKADPSDDSTSSNSSSTDTAGSRSSSEIQNTTTTDSQEGGLYKEDGEQDSNRFQRIKSKAKSTSKNKFFIGGALGAGSLLTILVIALIILAGAYKIVDFAEHVAAYEFARTTGQMAEDATNITDEEVDIAAIPDDTAGDSLIAALKDKYDTATGKVGELWSSLDDYRPGKVISNFQEDGTLQFNTSTTKLGRTRIDSVSINDAESNISSTAELNDSFTANHIPGFKLNSDFQYSRDFAPDLISALKANDIGPITRARVASQIRSDLDVGLTGWIAGRFAGKNQAAADAEAERESTAAAEGQQMSLYDDPSGASTSVKTATGESDGIDGAAADAQTKLNEDVTNKTAAIVADPNSTPPDVEAAIDGDVSNAGITGLNGLLGEVLSVVNPVYKYAVPLCLIYDGSIQRSGGAIDEQSDELERESVWAQAAAAQEKDGSNANGEAVGAVDWKLGDVTQSNAEKRASGIPVNTSTTLSTEASPTGQYTYSVADYLPGVGSLIDDLSPGVCSALTNTYVGVGVGVVGLGIVALTSLLTGGGSDIAAGATDAGGEAGVDAVLGDQLSLFDASEYSADTASQSPSLLSRIMGKAQNSASYAKGFAKDTGKQALAIGGLTLLAKQLVASEMGGSHSPTATGQSYDNGVDDGTNLYANQIEQKQFYGAPMTDANLGSDNAANQQQLASNESRQSLYNRYASINNPDSLVSNLAIKVDGYANGSIIGSITHLISGILSPLQSIGSLFSTISSKDASAVTPITSDNTYYGNVQFGFTPAEKNLLDSCPQGTHDPDLCSYQPLENQKILDESGNESSIAAKYGECFSDSIGTLLQKGDIKRDQSGDVIVDQGLCSPDNLGPDSPDSLSVDTDSTSPDRNDMIFRWRVAEGYNNTMEQLSAEQTVTPTDSSNTPASAGCDSNGSTSDYFTVIGSKICDENGNQYIPYGISVIDDLDQSGWNNPTFEAASDAQIQASANYWHVNSIRLQVSEDDIMDDPTPGYAYNLPAMQRLGTEINEIENDSKVPIINDNLERTDLSEGSPNAQTIAFWQNVMQYLSSKNDNTYSNIIFDIFNEPRQVSDSQWQSSMQSVVTAIRGQSNSLKDNLIMVEGPKSATTLALLDQYPIKGTNLAFAYHHVDFTGPTSRWETAMGLNLATSVPIVDGEWAQYSSSRAECYPQAPANITNYLNVLHENNIGLIFWSLEPGVGTQANSYHPISDTITDNFPTTASEYSSPNYFDSNYSCSEDGNGNLIGQGAGQDIMQYFEEYGSN